MTTADNHHTRSVVTRYRQLLGLSFALVMVSVGLGLALNRIHELNGEMSKLSNDLAKAERLYEESEVSRLLHDLSIPPYLLLGNSYRHLDHIQKEHLHHLRMQGHETVLMVHNAEYYANNWQTYKQAPLREVEINRSGVGQLNWQSYEKTIDTLRQIRWRQREGRIVVENPELYRNHVRPLVYRLLHQLPDEDVSEAAGVLLAMGEQDDELKQAIRRLFINPGLRSFQLDDITRYLKDSGYEEWLAEFQQERVALNELWEGKVPELQAAAVFTGQDSREDAEGNPLPSGALARLGTTRFRHSIGQIHDVRFVEDGRVIRARKRYHGSGHTTLWFDRETGKLLREFSEEHSTSIEPKGNRVLIVEQKHEASYYVKDLETGERFLTSPKKAGDHRFVKGQLSPDGTLLSTFKVNQVDGVMEVWDVVSGRKVVAHQVPVNPNSHPQIRDLAYSPSGTYLAVFTNQGNLIVWDTQKWEQQVGGYLLPKDFDHRKLLFAEPDDAVYVYDRDGVHGFGLTTGKKLGSIKGFPCVISQKGDRVLSCVKNDQKKKTVYSLPDFQPIASFEAVGRARSVEKKWVSLSFKSSVRVLDIHDQRVVAEFRCGINPDFLLLSPDGKQLVEADHGAALLVRDVNSLSDPVGHISHSGPVSELMFADSPDTFLSRSRYDIIRWERQDGSYVAKSFTPFDYDTLRPYGIGFSQQGHSLMAYRGRGRDPEIFVRDSTNETLLQSFPHELLHSSPGRLLFHPQHPQLVAAFGKGRIHFLDLESGSIMQTFQADDSIFDMTISRDGSRLACRTDDDVFAWSTRTTESEAKASEFKRRAPSVQDIALTSTGDTLVTLRAPHEYDKNNQYRGTIICIDPDTGKTLHSFWVGKNPRDIALSPDDRLVAVSFKDGRIQVHSLKTGQLHVVYRGPYPFWNKPFFSPDGQTLFTASSDTTILQWELPPAVLDMSEIRNEDVSP